MNQNNISFEAVIKGLECCQECDGYTCRNCCPYHDRNEPEDQPTCICHLAHDALALLKAQEPVEYVVHCNNADLSNGTEFACGECGGSLLHKKVNYCPWCGKLVKWE